MGYPQQGLRHQEAVEEAARKVQHHPDSVTSASMPHNSPHSPHQKKHHAYYGGAFSFHINTLIFKSVNASFKPELIEHSMELMG
jgi:hypothetical protein